MIAWGMRRDGVIGRVTAVAPDQADFDERLFFTSSGRLLDGDTLVPCALARVERFGVDGQVVLLELVSMGSDDTSALLTQLRALLDDVEILAIAAPEEVPWAGRGVVRSADDPDAVEWVPYTFYVPPNRFVPDADDAPVMDLAIDALADAILREDAVAAPRRPVPPPPEKKPAILLYLWAFVPAVALFLPYMEGEGGSGGPYLMIHYGSISGIELLHALPALVLVPIYALGALVSARMWRADPSARVWRWVLGLGAAVVGAALIALVVLLTLVSRMEVSMGVVATLVAYGFQLMEAVTFRAKRP
ncbi:MAG: hypothetical protein V4850_07340 [Myxococcota bacterium]